MQLPLDVILPESPWQLPDMAELPDWSGARRVAVDVETYDPNLKKTGPSVRTGGHLAGISFALEGQDRGYYLPIRHEGGDNLPTEQVLRYLRDQFARFNGEIVGANLSYDLDWLWEAGVEMPNVARYRDVLVAEPCINELKYRYSLNSVATEWLGEQKDTPLMVQAARAFGMRKDSELGAWIHALPGRYVGPYAETDATLPLQILREQEKEIAQQGLEQVWNLESDVLPVLVKMRRRGVRVDENRLLEIEVRCGTEMSAAAAFISRETGVPVGPHDAMKKALITKALRAAGHQLDADDSIDKHFIAGYENKCKVVAALGRLRKWDTLRKLCVEPVKTHLHNGRIHCSFNQMAADKGDGKGTKGARYGRLSSEHVNMQQQPARDEEIGPLWRRIYLPDEGKLWAACDYSQQEPKMLIHFAELCGFPRAEEAAQKYRDDPNTDNHQMMADMAGVSRKEAKIIFLGLCYGMGQEKLCRSLGLPTKVITLSRGPRKGQKMVVAGDEGAAVFEKFHTNLPFIRALERASQERAAERGYITTLGGRRCRFPIGDDGLNRWFTHKALNRLVQGSAADQTKAALVAADKEGFALQLQVHDEIDLSVTDQDEAEALAEVMRTCVQLQVPSKVDVEIGPSWGESMEC